MPRYQAATWFDQNGLSPLAHKRAALISSGIAATGLLTAGTTCNPNFNITQAGPITRWTPVKNFLG